MGVPVRTLRLTITRRRRGTRSRTGDVLSEQTGCNINSRGYYVQPGRQCPHGERKLYLCIEGSTEIAIKRARMELVRILEETTLECGFDKTAMKGKYTVL